MKKTEGIKNGKILKLKEHYTATLFRIIYEVCEMLNLST